MFKRNASSLWLMLRATNRFQLFACGVWRNSSILVENSRIKESKWHEMRKFTHFFHRKSKICPFSYMKSKKMLDFSANSHYNGQLDTWQREWMAKTQGFPLAATLNSMNKPKYFSSKQIASEKFSEIPLVSWFRQRIHGTNLVHLRQKQIIGAVAIGRIM